VSVPESLLLNPSTYDPSHFDDETRRLLKATIDWFEDRGLGRLTADYHAHVFYSEFLEFAAKEKLFSTFLTPTRDAEGDESKRWDTARVAALSEVLGFYGLNYWYPWQVTILGLGPVWMSDNEAARRVTAHALDAGGVAAFGLSEKEHGADIYASDLVLTPDEYGGYRANGSKYYIGNGNCATTVSVFGRIEGVEGPDQYVFFRADSTHPSYHLVKNVVPTQMYVAEFRLDDYPVRAEDILHTGDEAFSAALNTVNIGKFNLCFGGLGLCTHAFYEAVTHAHNRHLYGKRVTDMPHIKRQFVDAHARLVGVRLFCDRAIDYFRCASSEDRRYLLYNPVTKMKAATEAEKVMALLADVVAAKAFESDNYLPIARVDVSGLPKLEGTVAVNLALIGKFMPAYLFDPRDLPPIPVRRDATEDDFLFHQGPARGLGKVRFHDWRKAYAAGASIPNVARFTEQAESFVELLVTAAPDAEQMTDMDLMLSFGELFTLVVYGQLILEQAELLGVEDDLVDAVFDVLVRDFSAQAAELLGKRGSTPAQEDWARSALRSPVVNQQRFERLWQQVAGLSGAYTMSP
jgi:acyl-CoA dehydrogenase